MREFSQTLVDFAKGLRPDANMPRNTGYATELYNSRCGVAGLEVPPLIAYPISGAPAVSWPLPQLIKIYDLNFSSTGLHFIRYSGGILTISEVNSDYSLTSVFTKASINTRFTIADFGYYQIWAGIGLTVKRKITDDLTAYEWSEILVSGSAPPVKCVCNFRGQLIAGIYTPAAEAVGGVEDNLVAWSRIGAVDPTVMFDQDYSFIDRAPTGGEADYTAEFTSVVSANSGNWNAGGGFTYDTIVMGHADPGASGVTHGFVRFPNVTIPAGATITSAVVRFKAFSSQSGTTCNLRAYFNNVDNAVAPTSTAEGDALVLTDPVAWNSVGAWTVDLSYDTPSLVTILQTIIDRAGWASGQAIMVVVKDNSSSNVAFREGKNNTQGAAELRVEYTASGPAYPYKRTSGNYRTGPKSTVHRVLTLGNGFMVYCADKIFYMRAASSPEVTFGVVPLLEVGIASTFCAEGDEHEHLFITTDGEAWKIKENLKLERLGYKEFLGAMTGTIVISHNKKLGDFYISNGSTTYLLSPFGLSKWFQYPTSIVWEDTNKRLIGPIAVASDVTASMATDVFDFGVRGIKIVTALEMGSNGQLMTANVDYKFKVTDTVFTSSAFKTTNDAGAVAPMVGGVEFKMRVKGADYTKFDLDYLNVRYKYIDKRMIRGAYATDAKVLSRTGR